MITSREYGPHFEILNESSKKICLELRPHIAEVAEERLVPAGSVTQAYSGHTLTMLIEGSVRCQANERILFHYESPEIIGLELGTYGAECSMSSDFAVRVLEVPLATWRKKLSSAPEVALLWSRYYESRLILFSFLFASSVQQEIYAPPEVLHAQAGTVLIRQGEHGDRVYTLLEGSCLVQVDGVTVGEVKADEIFGALAVVGESGRTATVIADTPVVYLSVPKDKFLELMQYRPETVLKLIQDMTRALVALNSKMVAKISSVA